MQILVVSIICWVLLLLFVFSTAQWVILRLISLTISTPERKYPPSEIQVRVLTIDSEEIVQETIDKIQDDIGSVHVIAEKEMSIEGAEVNVVPDEFECEAIRKARAVEWSRRNIPCSEEFLLYIDEDTLLPELPYFPDSDIVQLSERPIQSSGRIPYLCEIFRMGIQLEQRSFPKLRYPLYAWGGGFAVKKELEDKLTWDTRTITEDTNFIWRAFSEEDVDMTVLKTKVCNQAPPTIGELFKQRRRWISGAILDSWILPLRYQVLSYLRTITWAAVVFSPLLLLPTILDVTLYFGGLYLVVVGVQTGFVIFWLISGVRYHQENVITAIVLFVTFPILLIINSIGATWAVVSPTKDFRPTKKVPPKEFVDETEEILADETEQVEKTEEAETELN